MTPKKEYNESGEEAPEVNVPNISPIFAPRRRGGTTRAFKAFAHTTPTTLRQRTDVRSPRDNRKKDRTKEHDRGRNKISLLML